LKVQPDPLSENGDVTPARRPRRRGRRLVIALLVACAALAALLAVSGSIVRRPAARAWLAGTIASQASKALGIEVRVGDARLYLLPPRLELRAVAVGPPGSEMVTVESLDVAARLTAMARGELMLDHLIAEGIRVDATVPDAEPRPSAPRPWARIVIRSLELRRVEVDRLGFPAGLELAAHDAEATWSADAEGIVRAAVVRVGAFAVRAPGLPELSGTLAARGRREKNGWEIGHLRASGGGWRLDGQGVAGDDGRVEASAAFVLDLAAADELFAVGAGLGGELRGEAELAVEEGQARFTAAVTSATVSAAGFAVADLSARLSGSPERLDAEILHGEFAGGSLAGTYSLAPLAAPWPQRVALRTAGTDIAEFLRALDVEPAGLAAAGDAAIDLEWEGAALGAGSGTATVELQESPGDVPVAGELTLTLAGDGRLGFATAGATLAGAPFAWDGTLTLGDWVPQWRFRGERLSSAVIARLLAGWTGGEVLPPELDAEIGGDIEVAGPFDDLTITARVAAAPLCLGALAVDSGTAAFTFHGSELTIERALLELGGGRVEGSGFLNVDSGAVAADLTGERLWLARVLALAGAAAPVDGELAVSGTVGGTLSTPRAELRLRAAGVGLAGVLLGDGAATLTVDGGAFALADLTLGPLSGSAGVDLAAGTARVDVALAGLDLHPLSPALAALAGGSLSGEVSAAFPLAAPSGRAALRTDAGLAAEARIDATGFHATVERPQVLRITADLAPTGDGYSGEASAEVPSLAALLRCFGRPGTMIDGSLAARSHVGIGADGEVALDGAIERAAIAVEGEPMELAAPARFTLSGGATRVERAVLVGPRSRITLAYAQNAGGAVEAAVDGELPVALLALAWPESKARGSVELALSVAGTLDAPLVSGSATVRNGAATLPGLPAGLTDINGTITLEGAGVRVDGIRFRLAGGDGRCSGRVRLDPAVELDLAIAANRVPWALLPRFRPVLDGELRVNGPLDRLTLSGEMTVVEAAFREQINLNTLVLDQVFARERDVLPTGEPVAFNLAVHIPDTLDIDTLPLRLQGRGELRLVGSSERIGLLGRVDALPGGEVEYAGQRYEIDLATVTFSQPDRIDPAFDVRLRGWIDGVEVTIAFAGTMARFTPTFSSNPPLSEMDILGLISTGQRGDEGDPDSLSSAASQFVNGQLASAVSSRARSLLNVDQLRLDPAAATTTGEPTTRMTVAQQLTRTWTVSISSNLSSNREEAVRSLWRVRQGLLLEAMRNADGSYSAGVKWQRRY
jgi:autotransporter translocation and assembly factor TamB